MGILKGIGLFLLSLVIIGAIGGGALVFFTLTEGIPFLKEKYQDLERFDDPVVRSAST